MLSALKGKTKKSVESISYEGIFYATALKSLKRDFGNPVLVSHLKIKSIFDQPQIKPNDKIGLRKYHQQVKIINTWLLSMGHENPIFEHSFSKPLEITILQMVPSIYYFFENWLERRIKDMFNSLDEIISVEEARTNHQQPIKENLKIYIYFNFTNASAVEKESQRASEEPEKQNEKKNGLTCCLCKEKHRLMDCHKFKIKPMN